MKLFEYNEIKVEGDKMKRLITVLCSMIITIIIVISSNGVQVQAASSTGVGLSAHCMNAYYEGWTYVYGACSYGYVDCSGLIYLYNHVGGSRTDMLASSPEWGYVSNGIPRIHGLGLHSPGHVGVYVGSGMGVDARNEYYGVCYSPATSSRWNEWFKVSGVSYPNNGWVKFNGNAFYYEDGQYIVDTTRTIDGVKYTFSSSGAANKEPDSSAYLVTDYSTTTVTSSSSSWSGGSSGGSSSSYNSSLGVGSSGDSVTKLQKRLIELGYFDDSATGYFGSFTEDCLKDFQKAAGLSATGRLDSDTKEAVYSSSAPPKYVTYTVGDSSDEILKLQKKLKKLQYFYEDATGYYGDITAVAVKQFQQNNGLNATGKADKDTQLLIASSKEINPNAGSVSYGMIGSMVSSLKERLIELRYADSFTYDEEYADTRFDKETLKAVYAYQKQAGLEKSKELSKEDLAVLYSDEAPKAAGYNDLKTGYTGDDVRELQEKLVSLRYLILKKDEAGIFGKKTYDAVCRFQRDNALEETGVANEATITAIDTEISRSESKVGKDVLLRTATITEKALSNARAQSSFEVIYINSKDGTAQQVAWFIVLLTFFVVCVVFINCLKNGLSINRMVRKKYYKLVVE